ncbi:MAG: chemotaxis protein CheR, partial [Alphaproteobacteria bacterium]|nr:chemotaxis protein CheR [Alphaproteobacteria bacterium]
MSAQTPDFELTDSDFKAVAKKIFDVSGIVLSKQKKSMVYSRL